MVGDELLRLETDYRAGTYSSNRRLAEAYGIHEATLRGMVKRGAWVRDAEGTKREIVKTKMAGIAHGDTHHAVRELVGVQADLDVADMQVGLGNARKILAFIGNSIDSTTSARDLKTLAEANALTITTIRKIRGLDDKDDKGDMDYGTLLSAAQRRLNCADS